MFVILHQILCAGYYALLGDEGLDAFAADVTAVLNNFRVAAKRSGLEIAARLSERKAADVAELALGTLNSLLEQHRARQTAAAKGSHGIAMVNHPFCHLRLSPVFLRNLCQGSYHAAKARQAIWGRLQ